MKIPFGISNFENLITREYYFADKTKYLPLLEDERYGRDYSLFIRPRRFGKSLFLSMMEYYYDVNSTDKFDRLFGNLYIGKNPTKEKNKYLILMFDFSGINTSEGLPKIKESFLEKNKNSLSKIFGKI